MNKISLSWEQQQMVHGEEILSAMGFLGCFYPRLVQFIPNLSEHAHRGASSLPGCGPAISIPITGVLRGVGGDLDHGFNHQPSAWLCLHWWQGPREGTLPGAQHCSCREKLGCPYLGVPSLMGTTL